MPWQWCRGHSLGQQVLLPPGTLLGQPSVQTASCPGCVPNPHQLAEAGRSARAWSWGSICAHVVPLRQTGDGSR